MTPWIIWTVITFLVLGYYPLASLFYDYIPTIVGLVIFASYLAGLALGLYCVMVVNRLRIEMKKELSTEVTSNQIDIEDPESASAPPSGFLNLASFKFKSKMKNEPVNINYQQFN